MNLTIIGGGGLGHVCAAVAASRQKYNVSILSGHPSCWMHHISATDLDAKVYEGDIDTISSNAFDVVPNADVVLLCVPGYLIERVLGEVRPYLKSSTAVGSVVSSTGFFLYAHSVLPQDVPLFGYQRVPYISRVNEYGCSAFLLGYKKELAVAIENHPDPESLRGMLEELFLTPTKLLDNYYEAALTNSNPILHTGRLYSMWHNWDGTPFDHQILFYKEWNIASSQEILDMDVEFMSLIRLLPVRDGIIPSLLDYYESCDAESLTKKITSIPSFMSILAPMVNTKEGWIPDFTSRYFVEDFPFGLKLIKDLAVEYGINTPRIDRVLNWGMQVINKD